MIKESIYGIIFYINLNKKGVTSFGKIISYEYDDGYKIPIIEFETQGGKIISKKPFFYESSDIDKFITVKNNINKNIRIVFEENNPEKFVIKVDKEFSYGNLILMIIIGIFFIFFGIYKVFQNIDFF